MKTLKNKPAPTTKIQNFFTLRLPHFYYWHTEGFPETAPALQFLVLHEYALESQVICEHVQQIKSLLTGNSIAPKGGLSVQERLSQQRLLLSKYLHPYNPDFLLDETFLDGKGPSRFAAFRNTWQKRGRPFPQVVQQVGNTFMRRFSLPTSRPRFDVFRPSRIARDDHSHTVIESFWPVLPDGSECVKWRNVANGEAELEKVRREYDETILWAFGDFATIAGVIEEAQSAIDAKSREIARADCIAVVVAASDFPATSAPTFGEQILQAARGALASGVVSEPFIAFRTELIGDHHRLRVVESVGKECAALIDSDNVRVVVFPRQALDADHLAGTQMQFHDSLLQHPAWAPWNTSEPKPSLSDWSVKKLKAALRKLWAFRYVHSIPAHGRDGFAKKIGELIEKRTAEKGLEHFYCHNELDRHKGCAVVAEEYFMEIFPQAKEMGDVMWRKGARR